MKTLTFAVACAMMLMAGCASNRSPAEKPAAGSTRVVDAGCGQCLLGLKEKKGCDLAVRLDGRSYFVDGFKMRQFGDPDADGGMCNRLHKARVAGQVVDGRFAATRFELLPAGR